MSSYEAHKAQITIQEKKRTIPYWVGWTRSGDSNKINEDLELLIHENTCENIDWGFKKTRYPTEVEAVIRTKSQINCSSRVQR